VAERRPRRLASWLGGAVVLAALFGRVEGQERVVLTNVTLIDGRGGPPVAGQSLVVEGDRISAIGPAATIRIPAGARIVDLTGRFLIPGLIDTHLHGPPDSAKVAARLGWLFRHGITSARDMAGDSYLFRQVAATAANRNAPLARLHYVAFWAGASFFQADKRPIGSTQGKAPGTVPWFQAVGPESDPDRLAADAVALGAHALKLYADLPADQFPSLVAAAHRRRLRAVSHVTVFPIRPRAVIAAGVDAVSHAALLVWEAVDTLPGRFHTPPNTNFGPIGPYDRVAPDDRRIVAVLETMRDRGVVLDATVLAIARGISSEASDWSLRVTALARRIGVPVSTGTDRPEDPSPDREPALFDEIELLVSGAGFTPIEAITAATWHGARAIGIDRERGTIEVGKFADLAAVAADPSRDIRALRRVVMVVKSGVVTPVE